MKEDLWKSFAMKHGYDSASPRRDSRDDSAARRERLRRVVDDIAYALYRGKMATAARVSRPHVGSANRAWLSAEFIQARHAEARPTESSRRSPSQTSPRPAESRRGEAGWHTARRSSRSRSPVRARQAPAAQRPSRTPMDSESNDEFFARHGGPARRSPARSSSHAPPAPARSPAPRRVPMDSQSNDEFFARFRRGES